MKPMRHRCASVWQAWAMAMAMEQLPRMMIASTFERKRERPRAQELVQTTMRVVALTRAEVAVAAP